MRKMIEGWGVGVVVKNEVLVEPGCVVACSHVQDDYGSGSSGKKIMKECLEKEPPTGLASSPGSTPHACQY